MRAAFFAGDRKVEIREVPRPKPGMGEVLVRMKASGICGSDIGFTPYRKTSNELGEEQKNLIRGHEPCGVVEELGPCARNVKPGDRVIVHHYFGCRQCEPCLGGWTQMCEEGVRRGHGLVMGIHVNGGHADYVVALDTSCVPLPEAVSFEEGAWLACGAATSYQALTRLEVSGRDTLAIFGQGQVGLSATALARAMGARVIALDAVVERLEFSKQAGADETVDVGQADAVQAILDLTGGRGADATLECSAVEEARVNCLKSTKDWGRACFVGELGKATFEMTPQIIHKQLTIYGSWTFSTHSLRDAARFVAEHAVPLKDFISYILPLEKADEAYQLFEEGKPGKMVLVMS